DGIRDRNVTGVQTCALPISTLLLPEGRTTDDSVERLFVDLHAACDELDVALVGGHTEVAHGLDRVVIAGTMLGEVAKDKLVTTRSEERRVGKGWRSVRWRAQ